MLRVNSYLIWLLVLLLAVSKANAETLSPTSFEYNGGALGYLERNEIFSTWNARTPSSVLRPGMKVMFFGRAYGCNPGSGDGPVKNEGSPRFGQALGLTGIPLAKDGKGQHWAPSADTEQCDNGIRGQVGDSFVHVNEDPSVGGIGIFTFTGPDQKGRRSFFRQFDKSGQNGSGANANIEGTFVAFRFAWGKGDTVSPWAGVSQPVAQRKADFRTVQSVAVVSVGDGAEGKSGEPVQAKQQFIVALINRSCFQNGGGKKRLCQLQYLFNLAVYRTGVSDWSTVKWFTSGGLFMDVAQGGMPVINGPVGKKGETTVSQGSGLELYTSLGDPSQHDVFKDKDFHIQISFDQFKNALKLIAAKSLNKNAEQVTPSDMSSIFTQSWDDPNEWMLISTNVSQEIYNPYENVRSYLGGAIRGIAIESSFHN